MFHDKLSRTKGKTRKIVKKFLIYFDMSIKSCTFAADFEKRNVN